MNDQKIMITLGMNQDGQVLWATGDTALVGSQISTHVFVSRENLLLLEQARTQSEIEDILSRVLPSL